MVQKIKQVLENCCSLNKNDTCKEDSMELPSEQCNAWISLYDATGGERWKDCSSLRLNPCKCILEGGIPAVTCDIEEDKAHISSLLLNNNSLTGSIPSSLSSLTGLKSLTFVGNYLTGSIPSSLSSLTNLNYMMLGSNKLDGSIPSSLSSLKKLSYLELDSNQLTGSIPSSLSTLIKLSHLDLSNNKLTGLVPSLPFSQYTKRCCLQTNNFTCPLPKDNTKCICNGSIPISCTTPA